MIEHLLLVFTSVLFIVDPFAVVPTFLAMTERDPAAQRRVLARRGAWTCAVALAVFAAAGSVIFRIFGITLGAFKIAGGILIGLSALDRVQARRSQLNETPLEKAEGIEKESPSTPSPPRPRWSAGSARRVCGSSPASWGSSC